jgi:ABC-type multidrug transport system ATPase subunit
VIEIQELYKYYGDQRAIGPLTTNIERGEIIGLLGLNGAGKTTTLRILACDLLPTSGSVKVAGVDVVERPDEVKSKVGYLPDRPPLYEDLSVRDYLTFAARLRGVPADKTAKLVAEAVELTELGDVSKKIIGSLSHGYKQRVGIAQAIVHAPELVVLDEPISGLDPVQIVEMRELVKNLKGEHTVVLSSHILSEISETCDRILVINSGKIEWSWHRERAVDGARRARASAIITGARRGPEPRSGPGPRPPMSPGKVPVVAVDARRAMKQPRHRSSAGGQGDLCDGPVPALLRASRRGRDPRSVPRSGARKHVLGILGESAKAAPVRRKRSAERPTPRRAAPAATPTDGGAA